MNDVLKTSEPAPESASKWDRSSMKFGISGAMEIRKLELALETASADLTADPDSEDKRDLKEIAELRIELFKADHDNAGAFKFNRLGRELRSLFDDENEHGLRLDDEGRILGEQGQANHRLLVVNMSELDRFNKEGGHEAGDGVLKNAAHEIEAAVLDVLKGAKGYRMYRSAGNEFMVDFADIDEELFRQVQERVAAATPTYGDIQEPAPLTVNSVSLAEAIAMVNQVQETSETSPLRNADEANRALVGMVRDLGGFRLEIDKFKTRTRRMRKKLDDGDLEAATLFFKNYLEREFSGTEFETIEGFQRLMEAGPKAWETEVDKTAFDRARVRYEILQEAQSARDAVIQRALNERLKTGPVFRERASLQDGDAPLATVPGETFGQRAVDAKRLAYEAVPDDQPLKKEKALLQYQAEDRSRDRGTGLYARGKYFSNLEKSLEKEGGSVVFIDMAFLKYFDQKGGRDVGNAALKIAADVLERTLVDNHLVGEAYRLGGDEFTVRLDGPESDAVRFVEAMNRLRDEAGRVPDTDRSDRTYAPTKLTFNYGICDRDLMEKVYADLQTAGLVKRETMENPAELANYKAELFTVIADKSIEEEKAIGRFHLLIGEMRSERYQQPDRRDQVDTLVVYSKKALFTEFGGDAELRRLAEDQSLVGEALDAEIRRVVAEKAGDAKKAEHQRVSLRNQLIELHVSIHHLQERLDKSEQQNAELEARLREVKAEKDKLLGIRVVIDGA